MRKYLFLAFVVAVLAIPVSGFGQAHQLAPKTTHISSTPTQTSMGIQRDVLVQVLTLAAPYFGFTPSDFIYMYDHCGCIYVEDLGGGVFRVEYGGLGIQIIIDGSRNGSGGTQGSRPR